MWSRLVECIRRNKKSEATSNWVILPSLIINYEYGSLLESVKDINLNENEPVAVGNSRGANRR